MFDEGECALSIKRWFYRTPDDPDLLTFKEWKPPAADRDSLFVTSRELRAVGVKLIALMPRKFKQVVRRTPSARTASSELSSAHRPSLDEPPPVANQKWKLDAEEDRMIRHRCEEC